MLRFSGPSSAKFDVQRHLASRGDLRGKTVIDIPAGKGRASKQLMDLGAKVIPLDLFPEFFEVPGLECRACDLMEGMPVEDGVADLVVCEEGIEHMPNQLHLFREFNRVLKTGGSVLITTPSISNLRGRFSHFLTEAEIYHRLPPNALDSLWHSEAGRQYFGHAFLIGIQRMRTLAAVSGFDLVRLLPTRVSWGSVALGFMYPFIVLATRHAYRRNMHKNAQIAEDVRLKEYGEVARLITSPTILFGKELFVEFRKREDWKAVRLLTRSDDQRVMDSPQLSRQAG